MARRIAAALVLTLSLVVSAVAMAATRPQAHASYSYVSSGRFTLTLDTKAAGVIAGGHPVLAQGAYPLSGIVVACPASAITGITQLRVGFPKLKLKARGGHFRFKRSYTWRQTRLAVLLGPGAGKLKSAPPAKVSISGTVANAKLITGTIAVREPGCEVPRSSFRAKFVATIHN